MPTWNPQALTLLLVVGLFLFRLPGADAAGRPEDFLVKGTGISITRQELEAEVAQIQTEATNRGEAILDDTLSRLRAERFDRMIFRRLVMAQATDADKRRATFEANAFVGGAKAEAPTAEAYRRRLKRAGFTEETFAADKFAEVLTATVLDRVIRVGIRIDDSTIRAAYDAEPGRWQKPATIRGVDLMMSSRDPVTGAELEGAAREEKLKQMRAIRARAVRGEDFSGLVREFSEDPQGRKLDGVFTLTPTGAAGELEEALAALKPGEISTVLTTPTGLHLVKLLETSAAGKTAFADAAPRIRAELGEAEFKKQLTPYVAKLRRDANLVFAPDAPRVSEP